MEALQDVLKAGEGMYAPVIVQTIAEMLKYTPVKCLSGMAGKLAAASKVPVVPQLDHG